MGYTHYYYRKENLDKEVFSKLAETVNHLLTLNPEKIALTKIGGKDETMPFEASPDLISFNGVGENGHETLYLSQKFEKNEYSSKDNGLYFECCKTAQKPYDLYVCATLILAKIFLKDDIRVSSDGELNDWIPAQDLLNKIFKTNIVIELGEILTIESIDNIPSIYEKTNIQELKQELL